jgi:hypothetical protein
LSRAVAPGPEGARRIIDYMTAEAAQVTEGLEVFSARSEAQGLGAWRELGDRLRLYRAVPFTPSGAAGRS